LILRSPETYEIGVDIGGTFTDIVAVGQRSHVVLAGKVLTDYADLARGVLAGIDSVLKVHAIAPSRITRVVHGTTLVTNCLIERRGAKTALITTAGFGDVLAMGRESRYDIYDIDIEFPQPLTPRERVYEVDERLDHRGAVVTPLNEADVHSAITHMREAGIESVAVCLLHASANSQHERRVSDLLRAGWPDVSVTLSSDVMPDLREYERASTTAANAYVKPVVKRYIERLAAALASMGVKSPLAIIASDGSVIDVQTAAEYPVRLTESGPAGGAIAAARLAGKAHDLVAYDMGGTTAKICVINDGEPLKSNSFEFGRVYRFARGSGLPLQIPVIEMIEIGAGGGSIARVNEMGMLQIGPESANASPGPACYALGGKLPTVTDADLVLGYLSAESFLGGDMKLDVARARVAIRDHVAKPLKLTVEQAAYAIHRVVNANMARAAKVHCLEHGHDPRRFTLFAYGGAGPVHAYGVARTLGVSELIFPARAGVMSALGFLLASPSFEVVRGRLSPLMQSELAETNHLLKSMVAEATRVVRKSVPRGTLQVQREVAVRYEGQSYELYVPLPNGAVTKAALMRAARDFNKAYASRYHALAEQERLEAVRWRVRVSGQPSKGDRKLLFLKENISSRVAGRRAVYVPEKSVYVQCAVHKRDLLPAGSKLTGPVLIEERESTVFVGAGARVVVAGNGDLRVSLQPKRVAGHNAKRVEYAQAQA
jgi:N-methylhydantoinase A